MYNKIEHVVYFVFDHFLQASLRLQSRRNISQAKNRSFT